MTALFVLVGLIGFLVASGLAESYSHRKNLSRIPIRIHVNGTRGKSSVTRLIAAGLRGAGIRTVAKTTGTLPRLILPDGSEVPIVRHSSPNVMEQRKIVREAAALEAEALVVECMALQPWLQWICESKLIRATHGVITNAREDHLDVMGPDETHVALALANMTPQKGILITAERQHRSVFERAAQDRGSRLIGVAEQDVLEVTDAEMARFSYEEHKENVALALRVCSELGIDRETALAGMCQSSPDPGATVTYELDFWGRRILFVNAFAANDPTSTERIWQSSLKSHPDVATRIAVFNCRTDRADRSRQLAHACIDWSPADHYVLTGTGTQAFARQAVAAGLDPRLIHTAEHATPAELFETLIDLAGRSALIVGMGNIGDNGLEIARFFRNRGHLATQTVARRFSLPALEEKSPHIAMPELQTVGYNGPGLKPSTNGKLKT